jgi:hypothetical protein
MGRMKKSNRPSRWALGAAVAAFLASASTAWPDIVIQDIRWQLAPASNGRKAGFRDAAGWFAPPDSKPAARPRVLATLANRSRDAEEAVLLRFAVSARLARVEGGEGTWGVPFILDDRRIPKVNGSAVHSVPIPINRAVLDGFLKRMRRSGFWPDALRVEVMVEPRPGDASFQDRLKESVFPVEWKQAPAGRPK